MTIQQIVSPDKIESELLKVWDGLAEKNTMRASLFNLVVFNQLSPRTDYIRDIARKVAEKFPCRTLFISQDPDPKQNYLKTAISVFTPDPKEASTACDLIDIGVAGSDTDKIFALLLPHFLPDLPIYVLWTEDPSTPHPLFTPLTRLATRVIFDSESADNLLHFSKTILDFHTSTKIDIADLNWARTQGWRDLLISVFESPSHREELKNISSFKLVYNARESSFFCHVKIQSMYLLAWLCSRLDWQIEKTEKNLQFTLRSDTQKINASIASETWDKLGSGTVISVHLTSQKGHTLEAKRIRERYHYVQIQLCSPDSCMAPYEFMLGQTATGQSLVHEICMRGTSSHYINMLKTLTILDKDRLC